MAIPLASQGKQLSQTASGFLKQVCCQEDEGRVAEVTEQGQPKPGLAWLAEYRREAQDALGCPSGPMQSTSVLLRNQTVDTFVKSIISI